MLTLEDKQYLEGMIDGKLSRVDKRIDKLDTKIDGKIIELEAKIDNNFNKLDTKIDTVDSSLRQLIMGHQRESNQHHIETLELLQDYHGGHVGLKERLHAATAP